MLGGGRYATRGGGERLGIPSRIARSRNLVSGVEACLSIPGYFGEVDRYEGVVITGQDRHGKPLRIKSKGWQARVFQHEIDHLHGILFTDKAVPGSLKPTDPPEAEPDAESGG